MGTKVVSAEVRTTFFELKNLCKSRIKIQRERERERERERKKEKVAQCRYVLFRMLRDKLNIGRFG